jgi:hypothetical protein
MPETAAPKIPCLSLNPFVLNLCRFRSIILHLEAVSQASSISDYMIIGFTPLISDAGISIFRCGDQEPVVAISTSLKLVFLG